MESDRDLKPAIQVGMIVPGSMESMGINVIELCKLAVRVDSLHQAYVKMEKTFDRTAASQQDVV